MQQYLSLTAMGKSRTFYQIVQFMTLNINIIGAGHLGKTIGYLLARHPELSLGAICNRSKTSSLAAIEFIGSGSYCAEIHDLPPSHITLITTPDDYIKPTCIALSKTPALQHESIVIHCSGSLSSEVLSPVSEKGCFIASIHPMRSFAQPALSVEQYPGTYCAVEGDEQALKVIKPLFEKIGSITYDIEKHKKSTYHAAGVFSSNYLITLAQQALSCMKIAGVENDMAIKVITSLMKSSIANLEKTSSPEQSLTGPIQRADITTIKKHMDVLHDIEQKNLYSSLGNATLHLTKHRMEEKLKIKAVLNSNLKNN